MYLAASQRLRSSTEASSVAMGNRNDFDLDHLENSKDDITSLV